MHSYVENALLWSNINYSATENLPAHYICYPHSNFCFIKLHFKKQKQTQPPSSKNKTTDGKVHNMKN